MVERQVSGRITFRVRGGGMNDMNEDRLVARVLRELSNIVEDCDIEGEIPEDDVYVFDLEMTFINLAKALRKRPEALEES